MAKELLILLSVCIGSCVGFIIRDIIYYKVESWKIHRYWKSLFEQPINSEPMIITKKQQKLLLGIKEE